MEQNVGELLRQGLIMTGIGMGLVFSALALLWGMMRLLEIVFRDRPAPEGQAAAATPADSIGEEAAAAQAASLTAERSRVAALVAGALFSNAFPLLMEPPTGPMFEHGRTAPSWVTANRARALSAWAPPRAIESRPMSEPYI